MKQTNYWVVALSIITLSATSAFAGGKHQADEKQDTQQQSQENRTPANAKNDQDSAQKSQNKQAMSESRLQGIMLRDHK